MGFINKIKDKSNVIYDVHDKRLEKVPVSEVENGVLKVTDIKSSGPTPVAEFDGVKYYHKSIIEKNRYIPSNADSASTGSYLAWNGYDNKVLLSNGIVGSGSSIPLYTDTSWTHLLKIEDLPITLDTKLYMRGSPNPIDMPASLDIDALVIEMYLLYNTEQDVLECYYNLEGEGAPTKISEVSDGPNTLPIHDKRIIEVSAADVGKVLTVESDGSLAFKEPAGGTKLYQHEVRYQGGKNFIVESIRATPVTRQDILELINKGYSANAVSALGTGRILCAYQTDQGSYPDITVTLHLVRISSEGQLDITDISATDFISDTVTEL